jgi:hypothetical protein
MTVLLYPGRFVLTISKIFRLADHFVKILPESLFFPVLIQATKCGKSGLGFNSLEWPQPVSALMKRATHRGAGANV